MPDTAFIFVVDGEKYEIMGALLAASIRQHHAACDVAIIAYSPAHNFNDHSSSFRAICEMLDIDRQSFENTPSPWAQPYPHGNKILACCARRDTQHTVFFDSDMIVSQALDLSLITQPDCLSAVPEGVPTWGREDEKWHPVYAHFGQSLPQEKIRLVRGRRIWMMPYFNAGLVGFPEAPGPQGQRFPDLWRDTALGIDHDVQIDNKRPWLDQISLPVTAARGGFGLNTLPEAYNFSSFRRKQPTPDHVRVFHYHIPAHFRNDRRCQTVWHHLVDASEAANIKGIANWADWYRRKRPFPNAAPDREHGQDT